MKPFCWLRLFGGFLAVALACGLRAQVMDDAVAVPVHFQGRFDAQTSNDPNNPASMTITPLGVSGAFAAASGTSMGGTGVYTSGGFARLRAGRTYLFQIDTYLSTRVQVKITPPSGHRVFINGVEHEMFDWQMGGGGLLDPQGFFSVRLDNGSGAAAGDASSLRPGRLLWSVGLGALRNGKPAGSLRLAEDGITANAFTPAALFYDHDAGNQNGSYVGEDGEVVVTKVNNILRQVYAATVLADIVTNDDHSYYIRLYARADVPATPDGQGVFDMTGKTPLFEFFIENPSYPSLTAMRVTKTTNQNGQLVMWTQMTQQTGQPSGMTQWLIDDWVEKPSGASAPSSPVRQRWTYSDSDRNEHLRIEDGSGNPVQCVFKRYEDYSFGVETSRELYYEIAGSNSDPSTTPSSAETTTSIKTTYTYFLTYSDTSAGNWHKVATIDSTDGSHTAFGYCDEFEKRGQIFQLRRPHKNTNPANTGPDTGGEITTFAYDFTDNFGTQRLPTNIQTAIDGTLVTHADFSYAYESITDASATYTDPSYAVMPLTVITRKDYSDSSNYLTTVTRVYREDADPQYKFFPGLPYSTERPDKTMTAMVYFHAQLQPSNPYDPFNPTVGAGARVHVTLQGTNDATLGSSMTSYNSTAQPLPVNFCIVSGKSALSRVLLDSDGLPKISEQQICTGATAWTVVRQDWMNYVNAIWPSFTQHRTATSGSLWNIVNNTWTAGRLTTTVGETGVSQTLTYDSIGRVQTLTRASASASGATISAQTFTMSYDPAGRLLSRTTTSGTESLTTSANYDTAGRLTSESASGQGTASYVYDVANRTTTVTLPTGATRIETRYLDGRLVSVTGTAQVAEYYDYGVETDGRRKLIVSPFSPAISGNARTTSAWIDRLGRPLQRNRPGFNNTSTFTESMSYDATTGKMTALSRTGYADTRFEYNGVGELTRRGLSLSGGTLQTSSSDRITDLDTSVESYNGDYWLTSRTWIYATPGSSSRTLVESTRQRLTGLSPALRAETRTIDVDGNETVRTVTVDATNPLVTVTTSRPGATNSATEISLTGFPVSATGFDGITYTRAYDALGRLSTTTDPRTGTSTTHYQAGTPLVDWVKDAANNQMATYTYDGAGRVIAVSDVAGKLTRTAYNTRDQVIRRWGPAATPVEYAYNTLGERTALRTFRSGDFTGSSWPLGDSGLDSSTGTPDPSYWTNGDKTTWAYDSYSGLLSSKTDANGKSVSYTYNNRGQTYQRTWARGVVTTYGYDNSTGELLTQSYTDGTPTVTYTYSRAAQIKTVVDTTGMRTFNYNGTDPLQLDSIKLPDYFNSRTLGRTYDSIHRAAGFILGSEVTQTYAYHATTGRFNTVTASSAVQGTRTFTYGYNTGGLISSLGDGGNFSVSYGYEANRDLLTSIDSQWSGTSRTRYDYTYNALGQRQTAKQSGDATAGAFADFGDVTTYNYHYNDRGELDDATDYLGTDVNNSVNQLSGRHFAYSFDNIGNRATASRTGTAGAPDHFTPNALNQYSTRENNVTHAAGTAQTASVMAVTGGTSGSGIGRQGKYWDAQVTLNNTSGPSFAALTITSTLVGQGSGGADLVRTEQRTAFLAKALQSFGYDDDGNLTSDGVWNYFYDAENRLTAMETDANARDVYLGAANARRLEFQYDYLNRRVQKLVRTGWNGSIYASVLSQRRYLYDGDNLAAELSGDGTSVMRSFTWGLDVAGSLTATGGVGALVQLTDHTTSTSYYPTYDGNGNIASLLRASDGAVVAAYEYSPFGELLRCAGSYATSNPFRFSTKFTDDESGLVYYGARYYSPGLGRFINRDPIEEAGGINLYGFAGNDGVNGVDYIGYSWLSKLWKKVWKPLVAIAVGVVTGGLSYALAPALGLSSGIATAAFAGGVGGFFSGVTGATLNGASLGGALRSGLLGGAMGALGGALGAAYDGGGAFAAAGSGESGFSPTATFSVSPAYLAARAAANATPSAWSQFVAGISSQGVLGAAAGGGLSYGAGLVSGIWGAAKGTVSAIAHPVNTVQGIANGLGTFAGRAFYDTGSLASDIGNWGYDTVMDPSRLGSAVGNLVGGVAIGAGINSATGFVARSLSAEGEVAALRGRMCFAAGTKVSTPQGKVNIEDIEIGDTVLAHDFKTGKTVERKVTDTPRNFTYYWVSVQVGDETIKATRRHLFWVESENRWIEAAELKESMVVRLQDGQLKTITAVAVHELQQPETTYNLVVDEDHNYFVGQNQVLVHNGYPESPMYPPPTEVGDTFQFNFDTSVNYESSRAAGVARARAAGLIQPGEIGHHINSVQTHPHLAAEPSNIQGVPSRAAHLEVHGGNWRNPTSGPLRPGC